jgi:hypothetical protein
MLRILRRSRNLAALGVGALFIWFVLAIGRGEAHSDAGAYGILFLLLGILVLLQGRFQALGMPNSTITGRLALVLGAILVVVGSLLTVTHWPVF